MQNEVYMNIPEVQKMAEQFGNFGELLQNISKVLEMTINVLRVTAFVGLVGGAAVERYLSIIKPRIDKASEKMVEIQRDLNTAVKNYQNGDQMGSSHFH